MTEPLRLAVDRTRMPAALVVAVDGELDLATADTLRVAIDPALDTVRALVLDLHDLRFCDSTGLSVLIGFQQRLAATGGRLHVAAMQPLVARVASLTEADQLWNVHPDLASALDGV